MAGSFICFTCKKNVGDTHGDAINHSCMVNADNVYVVGNMVYPFNPNEVEHNKECQKDAPTDANATSVNFKWTTPAVTLLLELRLSKENEFNHPSCKKKKLWAQIADKMMEIIPFHITGDVCDSKFRNLLATYKLNKKKQTSTGETAITWEFFNKMDEVLAQKASSCPQQNMLLDSLQPLSSDVDSEDHAVSPTSIESCHDPSAVTTRTPPRKKKKQSLTVSEYLYCKLKVDEEKSRKEEQRWKEKKELKEQEINAILELAKALNSNKQV